MAMWIVRWASEVRQVEAADQFEAWDTLRDEPSEAFGFIVTATPAEHDGDDDWMFACRASFLLGRWGRTVEAARVIAAAVAAGLPDTTAQDIAEIEVKDGADDPPVSS